MLPQVLCSMSVLHDGNGKLHSWDRDLYDDRPQTRPQPPVPRAPLASPCLCIPDSLTPHTLPRTSGINLPVVQKNDLFPQLGLAVSVELAGLAGSRIHTIHMLDRATVYVLLYSPSLSDTNKASSKHCHPGMEYVIIVDANGFHCVCIASNETGLKANSHHKPMNALQMRCQVQKHNSVR